MSNFKKLAVLGVFSLVILASDAAARDNSRGKGFPIDPTSERSIGQSLDYSVSPGGLVVPASPDNPSPAQIYGPSGELISVDSIGDTRALVVHNEDIDINLKNLLLHFDTGSTYTLASAAAQGDTAITLVDATGLVIGERLKIEEGVLTQQTFPVVTNIVSDVVTLDGPLDNAYTVAAIVEEVITDMTVVGSLGSPVSYMLHPPAGEIWHLTRMNFSMVHAAAADDSKFGGIAALANGLVLRSLTNILGIKTLTNAKTNGNLRLDMFDVEYSDKAGGGNNGTAGRWSFKQRTDTIIRLDGSLGDTLEALIQDDLTGLISFELKVQGHVDEIP